MKTRIVLRRQILCFVLAFALILSGEGGLLQTNSLGIESIQAQAATIRLNRTSCVLDMGKTICLKVIGTKSRVKWYTSNKSVAVVNSRGLVVAKKTGNAVITAKVGAKKYCCKIAVSDKIRFGNSYSCPTDGKYYFYNHIGNTEQSIGLYRVEIKTGKRKKIFNQQAYGIKVSGNWIYCSSYDNRDGGFYIYRISKTGRTVQTLAKGKDAVLTGRYLYYCSYNGYNVTGLWRMSLNGSNKKCLYKKKQNTTIGMAGLYKGKIAVCIRTGTADGRYYVMDSNGRKTAIHISRKKLNGNFRQSNSAYLGELDNLTISDNTYGYKYKISGCKVLRQKGKNSKVLHTFPGKIDWVSDFGGFIVVQARSAKKPPYSSMSGYYNIYIVSVTGKTVKKVVVDEMYPE